MRNFNWSYYNNYFSHCHSALLVGHEVKALNNWASVLEYNISMMPWYIHLLNRGAIFVCRSSMRIDASIVSIGTVCGTVTVAVNHKTINQKKVRKVSSTKHSLS